MFENEDPEDLNVGYLKAARQDPPPWMPDPGPSTAPMAALTPSVLGEMDQRVAGPLLEPQRPVQPRLTRMQERARRKAARRRFAFVLAVAALGMVVVGFILGNHL